MPTPIVYISHWKALPVHSIFADHRINTKQLCTLFNGRSQIYRITGHTLFHPHRATHIADDNFTGVDTDPHLHFVCNPWPLIACPPYVLRKILHISVRFICSLFFTTPFFAELLESVLHWNSQFNALDGWSGRCMGTPKTAIMASPTYLSKVPCSAIRISVIAVKYSLVPIHKRHLLAQSGVFALLKSST